MNLPTPPSYCSSLTSVLRPLAGWVLAACVLTTAALSAQQAGRTKVSTVTYHGWTNAFVIENGVVEAVVVPAVGRVMQFRFVGDAEGPFWENRALDGKAPDPAAAEWGNFGGDKAWPSPQADWSRVAGRGWPPPAAFDSMPVTCTVVADGVDLVSPVDAHYGIRVTRQVRLLRGGARLHVRTEFEKVSGGEVTVGVWVVTQLKDPVRTFIPLPLNSVFNQGFDLQSDAQPPSLRLGNNLISLNRDTTRSYKIGSDAGTLLWVGTNQILRIDSPRVRDASYPDHGSSAEIYTNGDPLKYVELEMLGPLETLRPGLRVHRESTYTLFRRHSDDAEAEARKVLLR